MDKKILAIDLETTGLTYKDRILTIGVSSPNEERVFNLGLTDFYHAPDSFPTVYSELQRMVNENEIIAMHNASFDLMFLLRDSLLSRENIQGKLFDTLSTARMTGARERLGLEALCIHYKISDSEWLRLKKGRMDILKMGIENVLKYNLYDARFTRQLAEILWVESVSMYGEDFTLRESDFCRLMAEIQLRGKKMHRESTEHLLEELREERNRLFQEVLWPRAIEGPNDRTGLEKYLERIELNTNGFSMIDIPRTDKGNYSFDKDSLEKLSRHKNPEISIVAKTITRTRSLEKLRNTYIGPFLDEFADGQDLIHGSYHVGGAKTFRLTSDHPNMQNIPRKLHERLWVEFLSADYSQAELRLATAYAREEKLAIAYGNNADVHSETAMALFGEVTPELRATAKNIRFLALYAGGAKTLHERYGVPYADAVVFVKKDRSLYPRFSQATRKAQEVWEKRGYLVLLSGKRIYATQRDLLRPYKAFNHVIQGGVAELVKEAMLQLDAMGIPIIGQVHDSIEFPPEQIENQEIIANVMENVLPDKISCMTKPPIRMKADFDMKGVKNHDRSEAL